MAEIKITENVRNKDNILYIRNVLNELLTSVCKVLHFKVGDREILNISCDENYFNIVSAEVLDKVAEIIVISYKYEYYKDTIKIGGLTEEEKEILYASLIAADLEDDKRYVFERIKAMKIISIDGIYNFRLSALKKKWEEVVSYIPPTFINTQLKDFIVYLLERKRQRVYIDNGKVYDNHYRRLKRSDLLGGEKVKIIREVLLSNCREVELSGELPKEDEKYLKEYYGDKIFFSTGYFGKTVDKN